MRPVFSTNEIFEASLTFMVFTSNGVFVDPVDPELVVVSLEFDPLQDVRKSMNIPPINNRVCIKQKQNLGNETIYYTQI